jgi:hypothetical protein
MESSELVSAAEVASPLLEPTVLTDLYEITMALSYLHEEMTVPATFSLFVRELPPDRGFLVASGIQRCLDLLPPVQVGEAELAAFATAMRRPVDDLRPLLGLRSPVMCVPCLRDAWCSRTSRCPRLLRRRPRPSWSRRSC